MCKQTINRIESQIKHARNEITRNHTQLSRLKKKLSKLTRLWKNSMTQKKKDTLHDLRWEIAYYERDSKNWKRTIKRLKNQLSKIK